MMDRHFRGYIRWVFGIIGLAVLVPVVIFFSPMDSAKKNQIEIIKMLYAAKPEFGSDPSPRVLRVRLGHRITLTPGPGQVEAGYLMTLHAAPLTFTITADPVEPGKTGIFSFFRDESGTLHFEPEIGRSANASSRRWGGGAVQLR